MSNITWTPVVGGPVAAAPSCGCTTGTTSAASAQIPQIVVGNALAFTYSAKDATGALFDLDVSAVATWHAPDGTSTTPTVTHVPIGIYTAKATVSTMGLWTIRFSNTTLYPFVDELQFQGIPAGF